VRRRVALSILSVAYLALAVALAGAAEIHVEAAIDPQIGLGDAATFTITASGQGFDGIDGVPQFALDNLKAVRGPFQSQNFSWVNGRSSSSVTLTWQLVPQKIGAARVYDIKVKVGDQIYSPAEQKIEVLQESPNGRAAQPQPQNPFDELFGDPFAARRAGQQRDAKLFLRAEATPAQPLVGQQMLYTVYLYTQADVNAANAQSLPTFHGFWARDVPQPQRQLRPDMVEVDGERYARVALVQKALFPLSAGSLTIEPARFELIARTPSIGAFGQLVPDMTTIDRGSNALTVAVSPLPPAPAGFPGTVGKLKLDARLEPPVVRAGEAATLTLTLSGQGNLQGVPDPPLPALAGVRVFPPQKSGSDEVQGTLVQGRRVWSYVLVPEHDGSWSLPPVEVPYFDLDTRSYKQAASAALSLNATPGAAPAQRPVEPVAAVVVPPPSAVPIWLVAAGSALAGAALLGAGLWIAAHTGRRRRSGEARRRLERALGVAGQELRPRPAAEAAEQAWRDFLAERWAVPTSTATDRWPDALADRGAGGAAVEDVRRLVADIQYLRQAPQLSATESLQRELHDLSRRLAYTLA